MSLSLQTLVNGIAAGSVFGLVALSLALIVQSSRFVQFAIGSLLAAGAFFYHAVTVKAGGPPLIGWCASLIGGAMLAGLMEAGVFQRLRRRRAVSLTMMIASLGLLVAVEGGLALVFGNEPLVLRTGEVRAGVFLAGVRVTRNQILSLSSTIAVSIALWIFLRFAPSGKFLRAVADDPELAVITGVPVERLALVCALASGALAGWAGVLIGLEQEATPTMGFQPLLLGVAGMVSGGTSRLWSSVLGACLLGVAQQITREALGGGWSDGILFGAFVIVLILRPQGVFNPRMQTATN